MSGHIYHDILHSGSGRRHPGIYVGLTEQELWEADALAKEHERQERRLAEERMQRIDDRIRRGLLPESERERMVALIDSSDFEREMDVYEREWRMEARQKQQEQRRAAKRRNRE